MHAQITIDVDIHDAAALRAKAGEDYLRRANGAAVAGEEAVDFLGTVDEPKLDQCLRQLYDVPQDNAGFTVNDSHAVLTDGKPKLRHLVVVTASTEHLTPEELERMNASFQYEVGANQHDKRAYIDINHDGLYISPKDYGFYVRVPNEDSFDMVRPGLSPEMGALIDAARAQGATRIEFDCDEDAVDGFAAFDHE